MGSVNYGPLEGLFGLWVGADGMDISPEADGGTEQNAYHERLEFEAGGDVENAESQLLAVVPYRQVVSRKRDQKVIHQEQGYILWDAEHDRVVVSFSIPRGLSVVAGGSVVSREPTVVRVKAAVDSSQWPISQSPFLTSHAKTLSFERSLTIGADSLRYSQSMRLQIYGRAFDHTDANTLRREA